MSGTSSPAGAKSGNSAYPPAWQGWLTLAILIAALMVSYLDRLALGLMVAPIKADLKISDFEIGLLVGVAFSLFYSVFGIPMGRLADQFNRKWLIIGGIILWSLATISTGLAGSFLALFLGRVAVGIGECVLSPSSYSMLGDLFPPARLVRATAALSLAATLSGGLALLFAGQMFAFVSHAKFLPLGLMKLAPWHRTFIIVAMPGFLIALVLLTIREPARRSAGTAGTAIDKGVFAYLWAHRRVYLPIHLCATGMAAMMANSFYWFPTFFIRTFGDTPAAAGTILGIIQICGAVGGTALGLAVAEWLMKRGYSDGPLRTVAFIAIATALSSIVFFVPSRNMTLALWLVSAILQNSYYGNVIAALQIVTPSGARGTNTAILYLLINLVSVAIGGVLIGLISDKLFPGEPRGVGYALAIVGGSGTLLASYAAWKSLRPFRHARALLEQRA